MGFIGQEQGHFEVLPIEHVPDTERLSPSRTESIAPAAPVPEPDRELDLDPVAGRS